MRQVDKKPRGSVRMIKRTKQALRVAQALKLQQTRAANQLKDKPHRSTERIMRVRMAAILREAIYNLECRL